MINKSIREDTTIETFKQELLENLKGNYKAEPEKSKNRDEQKIEINRVEKKEMLKKSKLPRKEIYRIPLRTNTKNYVYE